MPKSQTAVKEEREVFTSRCDVVFKTIICNENDKKYLKKILEVILGTKINHITFMKSERPKFNVREKVS